MRSLKAGAVLLSIWSGVNLLLAVAILVAITLFARRPPSLSLLFTDSEIARLPPNVLALVNALAVLLNACVAAFCLLVLVVTWTGLMARARWAFWALASSMGFLQAFGYVSDACIGNRNVLANLVSTAVLIAGVALSAHRLHRPRTAWGPE